MISTGHLLDVSLLNLFLNYHDQKLETLSTILRVSISLQKLNFYNVSKRVQTYPCD